MFDWDEFFEKEIYTKEELEEAVDAADDLPDRDPIIIRDEWGDPDEIEAWTRDAQFYDAVSDMELCYGDEESFEKCKKHAIEMYHRIEPL